MQEVTHLTHLIIILYKGVNDLNRKEIVVTETDLGVGIENVRGNYSCKIMGVHL